MTYGESQVMFLYKNQDYWSVHYWFIIDTLWWKLTWVWVEDTEVADQVFRSPFTWLAAESIADSYIGW